MATSDTLAELSERVKIRKFDHEEVVAALEGRSVPSHLGWSVVQKCVIRGICYTDGSGHELRGVLPEFTRALNARDIMSNRIPEIINFDEDTPYYIWRPEIATEDTYRQLVKRCPHMAYNVGRACAVAAYTNLFLELDLLSDVHIAEEARECGKSDIFNHITTKPVRCEVMNDFDRTINATSPSSANLDGNTAVRSSLDIKQEFSDPKNLPIIDDPDDPAFPNAGYEENVFDISEDMCIDKEATERPDTRYDYDHHAVLIQLLTNSLPRDLPTMDKNMLILSAAYNGDIDRYARLRYRTMVSGEAESCMRGVYHNTMFAVWWSKQKIPITWKGGLEQAVCARFIMNNVLSPVSLRTSLPSLIWYPTVAAESTYRQLAKIAPRSIPQVLRACIYANYECLFDELIGDAKPDDALLKEAERSLNKHFEEALLKRVAVVGKTEIREQWKLHDPREFDQGSISVEKSLDFSGIEAWDEWYYNAKDCFYNGSSCDASKLDLWVCLPREWKLDDDNDPDDLGKCLDYIVWPPRDGAKAEDSVDRCQKT